MPGPGIRKGENEMNPNMIKQTIQLWNNEPEKAKASPVVKARTDGAQAVVETGPFSWRTDLPLPLGGENKAASPTAMLLGALAARRCLYSRHPCSAAWTPR
jgi:hypothetical protein